MILANFFQPLVDIFSPVLVSLHNVIGGSWGWSIIALTVVIRALLLPLAFKQFHSMQKLQRVAPELKAIQAKYKDDKQRQQQEVIKFYRENDIKPFASFLPLVLQLPVFIGLFYTLRTSLRKDICPSVQHAFQLHYAVAHHVSAQVAAGQTTYCTNPAYAHFYHGGAGWLFIPDLTNTASGIVLVVLILLYVGTQIASTLMMSTPTMDKTQRRLTLLLPLFFVLFIITFPAGLILYWITTNVWTMGQQYLIRKRAGPLTPLTTAEPAAPARGEARAAAEEPNGSGYAGLAGLLRRRSKTEDGKAQSAGKAEAGTAEPGKADVGKAEAGKKEAKQPGSAGETSGSRPRRQGPPPPPPRNKKKRSGRRR
jgi:YidC/Oxa1 family membrane protein insertase